MSRWWEHRRVRLEARSSTDPDGRTFPRCGGTADTLPSEGSGLTAMQVRLLSPGPIYRDVAELVYATGREPAEGDLMRVQIPSSRPFFARLELKRESGQPPRLNRGFLWVRSPRRAPSSRGWNQYIRRPQNPLPERACGRASHRDDQFQSPPGAIADARVLETRAHSGHTGATPVAATIAV